MDQMLESSPRFQELIRVLEEERQKVEVFHRELPLCLHLINQTIESYKQLALTDENPRQELAAKELISLRPTFSDEEDHMTSMHQEICRDSSVDPDKSAAAALGSTDGGETGSGGGDGDDNTDGSEEGEEKEKCHRKRKVRRYWTEELHKRFVLALEQLGGCHAATPKRIRKVMKVEGLTNDEIKSHLQKFRIHARRRSPMFQSSGIAEAADKFVVVRGIWIPTPDCSTLTATDTPPAWRSIPATAGASDAGNCIPVVTVSSAPMFQGSNFYSR